MTEALGLTSTALRDALQEALSGRRDKLALLLARHGGLPGLRANLTLAAAFGEEIRSAPAKAASALLEAFTKDSARPDEARTFLPIAAAFGAVARWDQDFVRADALVLELLADDRPPVRVGLTTALGTWALQKDKGLDQFVVRAREWLNIEDRDHRFAALAIALDVVAFPGVIEQTREEDELFEFLAAVLAGIADAPRAAERSPARRKVLLALPPALTRVGQALKGGDRGVLWLEQTAQQTRHPDVRHAFEDAIERMRRGSGALPAGTIERLRSALASSAKPPRDPSRIREGRKRSK